MRRVAVLVAVLIPLGLLTACSPAVTGVAAIGYDAQGRLVGAAKVCGGDFSKAHLGPTTPEGAPDVGTWGRSSPMTGTESWPLRDEGSEPWTALGPPLPGLDAGTDYVFWIQDENGSRRSDFLSFRGSDLGTLAPGQVLVRRYGQPDPQGKVTTRVATIALAQLTLEAC